jgi:hypothetical protein
LLATIAALAILGTADAQVGGERLLSPSITSTFSPTDSVRLVDGGARADSIVFTGRAEGLVPDASSPATRLWRHVQVTGETRQLDLAASGAAVNQSVGAAAVSADGTAVVFKHGANLATGAPGGPGVLHRRVIATGEIQTVLAPAGVITFTVVQIGASSDGRRACLTTFERLTAADTNGDPDVYVVDFDSASFTLVSAPIGGAAATGTGCSMVDNATVLFSTTAALVANDTNARRDLYIHSLPTGFNTRVSLTASGGQLDGDSTRGRAIRNAGATLLFFESDAPLLNGGVAIRNAFRRSLDTGQIIRLSVPEATSILAVATDGSAALVDRPESTSAHLRRMRIDLARIGVGATITRQLVLRYSFSVKGGISPSIPIALAADEGTADLATLQLVAPGQSALAQRQLGIDDAEIVQISFDGNGPVGRPTAVALSDAAMPPVTGPDGDLGWPAISRDGRFVAFYSAASNVGPSDPFGNQRLLLLNRQTGQIARIASAWDSRPPAISGDGGRVAFTSTNAIASDTPNGHSQVYVWTRSDGSINRITGDSSVSDGDSRHPAISDDGSIVAFSSLGTNLAPGGSPFEDVFVHDLSTGLTSLASVGVGGANPNGESNFPSLSDNGRYLTFCTTATNIGAGTQVNPGLVIFDRQLGTRLPIVGTSGSGCETHGQSGNGLRMAVATVEPSALAPERRPAPYLTRIYAQTSALITALAPPDDGEAAINTQHALTGTGSALVALGGGPPTDAMFAPLYRNSGTIGLVRLPVFRPGTPASAFEQRHPYGIAIGEDGHTVIAASDAEHDPRVPRSSRPVYADLFVHDARIISRDGFEATD